jgi:hypothetical protein
MNSYELALLDEVEDRFRALIVNADFPEPDEVRKDTETGELTLLWSEQRVVIVVGPDEPDEADRTASEEHQR